MFIKKDNKIVSQGIPPENRPEFQNIFEPAKQFFEEIQNPTSLTQPTIIDFIEKLEKPVIKQGSDLKELYYKNKRK